MPRSRKHLGTPRYIAMHVRDMKMPKKCHGGTENSSKCSVLHTSVAQK